MDVEGEKSSKGDLSSRDQGPIDWRTRRGATAGACIVVEEVAGRTLSMYVTRLDGKYRVNTNGGVV